MTSPVRILIADDQKLFREGLHTLLSVQPDLLVVGEARHGEEVLHLAATLKPDVILMDLRMPLLNGIAATRRLKNTQPECKVIVLTTFDDDEDIFEGLRAGAVGYLLKDVSSGKLVEAIRAVACGESFLQPSIAGKVIAEFARLSPHPSSQAQVLVESLSERELNILRLLSQGATNKEIASRLIITVGTVKNHVTNILAKLGVRDRTQAAMKAKELGII
ncbi:DNA-binding response regulator [Reticulibacter mediterranei]|uniref:DNA-binding response regulator n=1 Tax=Reticulibacter mediterranei TaxID=2778369 RepID=A0A8J3IL14_9CHLR|nr:response regulator transcription factor [Reticulibacter mediterranei]GHO96461.1 DNA-binding response regulator [Reticulibacter mediterranei]